jgi:hypothetical protein
MLSRVRLTIAFALLLSAVCCVQSYAEPERVGILNEMRKPLFSAESLIGKTFDAGRVDYTSLGSDTEGVFIPYVFDEDRSRYCVVVLGRKMSVEEEAAISAEDQRDDSLIVDAFVITKKKAFVIVAHLLSKSANGQRWEGVDNTFAICQYNSPNEIVHDKYIVPEYMLRFDDGYPRITLMKNYNGRIYIDSNSG